MKRVALALIALVTACGGSTSTSTDNGAAAACSAACGGNVVGKWNIVSFCGPSTYQMSTTTCAEPLGVDRAGETVTGTFDYRADGTLTASMTMSGSTRITYPAACLTYGGITITCDQLNQAMQLGGASMADAGITGYSCVAAAAGACACTAQMATQTLSGTGAYAVSGSVLTQATGGGSPGQVDFCVQGTRMTQTPRVTGGDAGVSFSSGVGYVLEKQP
jgi:hypothetical protein